MTTLLESPTLLDSRTLVAAVDDAPEALVRKHVGLPADAEPDERWDAASLGPSDPLVERGHGAGSLACHGDPQAFL